jgi:hypothetical protein
VTSGQESVGEGVPFDPSRAHMALVYDFWLDGKDNLDGGRDLAIHAGVARKP